MTSVTVISAKTLKDNDLRNIIILKGDLITDWKEGRYTFKSFLYKRSFYVCLGWMVIVLLFSVLMKKDEYTKNSAEILNLSEK